MNKSNSISKHEDLLRFWDRAEGDLLQILLADRLQACIPKEVIRNEGDRGLAGKACVQHADL